MNNELAPANNCTSKSYGSVMRESLVFLKRELFIPQAALLNAMKTSQTEYSEQKIIK